MSFSFPSDLSPRPIPDIGQSFSSILESGWVNQEVTKKLFVSNDKATNALGIWTCSKHAANMVEYQGIVPIHDTKR